MSAYYVCTVYRHSKAIDQKGKLVKAVAAKANNTRWMITQGRKQTVPVLFLFPTTSPPNCPAESSYYIVCTIFPFLVTL